MTEYKDFKSFGLREKYANENLSGMIGVAGVRSQLPDKSIYTIFNSKSSLVTLNLWKVKPNS